MDLSQSSEALLRAYLDSLPKQDKPILLNEDTVKTVFLDIDIQQDFVDVKQTPVVPRLWPQHAHKNEDIDFNKEVL